MKNKFWIIKTGYGNFNYDTLAPSKKEAIAKALQPPCNVSWAAHYRDGWRCVQVSLHTIKVKGIKLK